MHVVSQTKQASDCTVVGHRTTKDRLDDRLDEGGADDGQPLRAGGVEVCDHRTILEHLVGE